MPVSEQRPSQVVDASTTPCTNMVRVATQHQGNTRQRTDCVSPPNESTRPVGSPLNLLAPPRAPVGPQTELPASYRISNSNLRFDNQLNALVVDMSNALSHKSN